MPKSGGIVIDECAIVAGSASRHLAEAIADELGTPPTPATVERFPDGEVAVRLEATVRGRRVFIVQSTAPPVDVHLVELLAFVDACRRAAAGHITAVIPYFGYARSDRRKGQRVPVMASLVAELLQAAGVRHVITVDVHSPQLEGFFRVPVDNLTAIPTLARTLEGRIPEDAIIVAPDLGAAERASAFAGHFDLPVAVLHKRRRSGTQVEVTQVVGEVRGRPVVLVDDMISTGGTIAEGVRALIEAGARPECTVAATHGVLTGPARERLSAPEIRQVVLTDTIAIDREARPPMTVASVAPLLASAIGRVTAGRSLEALF